MYPYVGLSNVLMRMLQAPYKPEVLSRLRRIVSRPSLTPSVSAASLGM
jgi:hypothetical protein